MATEMVQNQVALYIQPDGKGTTLSLASVSRHGMGDLTIPYSGRDPVPGRDEYGNPIIKDFVKTVPGGLLTANIEWHKITTPEYLEQVADCGDEFGLWKFYIKCGAVLTNLAQWQRLDYIGGLGVTQLVDGAGPALDGSGNRIVNNVDISGLYRIIWTLVDLASQTNASIDDLNDIAGLHNCASDCVLGYPGADQILYAVESDTTAATANVIYTRNGGGTWAACSAKPFGANENIGDVEVDFISGTQLRVVVGRATADAGNPPEVAYADVSLGAEGTTTWNAVNVGATNNDTIQALAWLFYDRMYVATAGDIYVSTDQAESWGTAIYAGANAINMFAKDADDNVWAVGAANTILRELGKSGTFSARTGPAGGGAFTSIAIAHDGRIYAGNGTKIYVSTNAALNTGGWTELYDFGANHAAVAIHCGGAGKVTNGDSQIVTAIVDDSTPGVGGMWRSWDGGSTWREVTELTNTGYNAAYFSRHDDNLVYIVGDDLGAAMGAIHVTQPTVT